MRHAVILSSSVWLLVPVSAIAQPADPVAAPPATEMPALPAATPAQPSAAEAPSAQETAPSPPVDPERTDTPTPPAVHGVPEAEDVPGEAKKKKKKKEERNYSVLGPDEAKYGRLVLGGRVFAGATFSRRDAGSTNTESLDLAVNSARIDVEYEAPNGWLSLDLEFDVAGNPEVKDAFIQAKGRHFFARAGHFKPPVSAIEMESPWNLPMADGRGFISDLLVDYLDVAGRRPGALVGVRGRGGVKPRFSVGAFQGSVLEDQSTTPGDRDVELIEEQGLDSQGFAARFDVDLSGFELGAFYQHRIGSPTYPETEHYPTGGLDLFWDKTFANGGVRVWADALVGTSWYEYAGKEADDKDAIFVSGRVIAAYRFGGVEDEALYIEPFGVLGAFEPDTEVSSDLAIEAVLGVNVGFWRRARLTLQGEFNQGDANFPNQTNGYLFGLSPDRVGLVLQAGMAF